MSKKIRLNDLLLSLWREACRNVEIHESTRRIAALLLPHVPLSRMLVRRIRLDSACVETVAVGAFANEPTARLTRTPCSPDQVKRLLTWCQAGRSLYCARADLPPAIRRLVPASASTEVWIGPLQGSDGPRGVLIFVPRAGSRFADAAVQLLSLLLEPLSVALENDGQLHKMIQLREAAEADRRALLTKLGRNNVTAPIVGADAGLQTVMERVSLVAGSDVPVLLFGETGTGKEVIARAIHNKSPRAPGPFIRVNCGAMPPELIDSQLFGHEKGSFTGAIDLRKGWFERADGGTLFLDEIGDLPLAAQVRLLRVLEDEALERVGGQRSVRVDVRIVGATHRDLAAMVRSNEFREDLWHRLVVFPIFIPPLRERPRDIGPLACHFAEKAATRFGLALAMPTVEDIHRLMSYTWPGNVRELAAVIDRAALLGIGRRLDVATALGAVPSPTSTVADTSAANAGSPSKRTYPPVATSPSGSTEHTLDEAMRVHIETALRASCGRVEGPLGAAARLNINPNTLRSRMRRLGIDWRGFRSQAPLY